MPTWSHPIGDPEPETIPLRDPPLSHVVAQVRFSPVLRVAQDAFVADFQQAIADLHPIVAAQEQFAMVLPSGPEAPVQATPTRVWTFSSQDGRSATTLTSTFVAVETKDYQTNESFFQILRTVLEAVTTHVRPRTVQRVGIRYVQRLTEPGDLNRLTDFTSPAVLGVVAGELQREGGPSLLLTHAIYTQEAHKLMARWGLLPPGVSVDPLVEPVPTPSWLLDIDSYDEISSEFNVEELLERLFAYSRRQYQFFRWAVRPDFLLRFGADPAIVDRIRGYDNAQ